MLKLDDVGAGYGAVKALEGVSLQVQRGQMVCLLGANGAGKSTTLNCISGVVPLRGGDITLDGESIAGKSTEDIVRRGIAQVP